MLKMYANIIIMRQHALNVNIQISLTYSEVSPINGVADSVMFIVDLLCS